jgi:hypothetical protein
MTSVAGQPVTDAVSRPGAMDRPGGMAAGSPTDARSYYGRPVLKQPVWRWPVPAYLFSGGLAAGSALIASGARLAGDDHLAQRTQLASLAAVTASAGFLIEDLGRPSRFHHMLRVARVTSPMSMGSWILAGFGPATGMAAISGLTGIAPRLGRVAAAAAAVLAPAVASYTAVLLSDTSIPVWHEARFELPFLFTSGAAASSGALAVLLAGDGPGAAGARRLALAGAAGEVAASRLMEHRLGPLARPYHEGLPGYLSSAARALTLAGSAGLVTGRRPVVQAGSALIMAGALLERFAVFRAGFPSAADPDYTVVPQRQRLEREGR